MYKETEFLKGIVFEENPFEKEPAAHIQVYDLDGNEVELNEAK